MHKAIKVALCTIGAVGIVGCGGPHPVPAHGYVTRHDHMIGYFSYCGKGCMIWNPEHWSVTVKDLHNPGWNGTVDVNEDVYNECDRPKMWPECWGGKPK